MGFLHYGARDHAIEIDDRPLAHLKVAILSLLRAGTSTALTVTRSASAGSGRETLWLTPTTDLRFRFVGSRPPALNPTWVHALIDSAATASGMQMLREPARSIPTIPISCAAAEHTVA